PTPAAGAGSASHPSGNSARTALPDRRLSLTPAPPARYTHGSPAPPTEGVPIPREVTMTATAAALPAASAPQHSPAYRFRRLANWLPLGLTYATFYMGRYSFNVVKGDMGARFHLDKAEMGIIATAGFWTYALSVIVNGPLADRIGGRRAILFGAVGA